ncbi:hypothetical protein TRFO_02936 [Tritrichomonas foetus]|uniref:TPR Domain containing protein n=1 Tax=Tritrichomonas foetus TaxID=1144522 RepID=A0A1J4KWB9_9EUKA|nr:hypothetical protein TRFO_02936 [Tritrichomonas foetus]|eukprot:OHT15577.1 hypothetical protein TRFO_02936 [Tritrichomonas foetus]
MLNDLPENAIPLTSDRELYKIVLEEGNKKNHSSNFNDTCVGVQYIIKSEVGLIDHTDRTGPVSWIVGDRETEADLYLFLPIVIRSMYEGETAKYFFTRKYFLGGAPVITTNGSIDKSTQFQAIVHLIKATPIDDIEDPHKEDESEKLDNTSQNNEQVEKEQTAKHELPQNSEKVETSNHSNNYNETNTNNNNETNNRNNETNNSNNNNKETKTKNNETNNSNNKETNNNKNTENDKKSGENKPKIVEVENDEAFKRRKFALNQLIIAENLLRAGKPAMARKEFNRARMSWSTQVDLSKAPNEISHPALDLPEDKLKIYVDSRALYGVARTLLDAIPPNTEKAVVTLREAIEIDPDFFEAPMLLEELGIKPEEEPKFPSSLDDMRLTKQQFWMKDDIEWSKRTEYAEYCKEKATELFRLSSFKEAMTMYARGIISYSGQAKKELTLEQRAEMNRAYTVSKLNSLACYLGMQQYRKLIQHADELFDALCKVTTIDVSDYKVKCLYRKALGLQALSMDDSVEEVIKKMKTLENSELAIKAIRKKQQEDIEAHKQDQDFIYSKMTGTLK